MGRLKNPIGRTWKPLTRAGLLMAVVWVGSGCGRSARKGTPPAVNMNAPIPELTAREKLELAQFMVPKYTAREKARVLAKYEYVDPSHEVPDALLKNALVYYDANLAHITNSVVLTVVDFSLSSSQSRMFVVDMNSGSVTMYHMAHGSGSDPQDTGFASRFGNAMNSKMSSLGYYKTAETYIGKHGLSLRLDGLSATNSNVRPREIVVHGALYVHDDSTKSGRSSGCLAVSMANYTKVVDLLKGGSIIFADTTP